MAGAVGRLMIVNVGLILQKIKENCKNVTAISDKNRNFTMC